MVFHYCQCNFRLHLFWFIVSLIVVLENFIILPMKEFETSIINRNPPLTPVLRSRYYVQELVGVYQPSMNPSRGTRVPREFQVFAKKT